MRRVRATIVAVEKCVFVDLGIQQAVRMRRIVVCSLSRSTVFSLHYLTRVMILEKKLLNMKYVFRFSLQLSSETFLILRRTA